MAVMLRTLGVPTRNVTGFIGGTYNRFAHSYAVRQGDAHSWVEVYLDDAGVDPLRPHAASECRAPDRHYRFFWRSCGTSSKRRLNAGIDT